jgi:CBS domain-containing protein
MQSRIISELPVVDRSGHPVGLIDLTDLIGLLPSELEE